MGTWAGPTWARAAEWTAEDLELGSPGAGLNFGSGARLFMVQLNTDLTVAGRLAAVLSLTQFLKLIV